MISSGAFRIVTVSESPRLRAIRRLLDEGEAQALVLAEQSRAPVLMDERRGRIESRRIGIRVIGTGALLVAAKQRGLVDEVGPLLSSLILSAKQRRKNCPCMSTCTNKQTALTTRESENFSGVGLAQNAFENSREKY